MAGKGKGGGGGGSYAGTALMAAGAVGSMIGAFYSVKSAQYQAKSQAMTLEFEQFMSYVNARNAEQDAQATLTAAEYESGKVGMQYKQIKEATRSRQAARGIQGGVGSAGEIAASIEFAKESDRLAITRNAVQAASAHRTRKTNIRNRGRFAGVSAANLRGTAGALNPWISSGMSLLGSAGDVAKMWKQETPKKSD